MQLKYPIEGLDGSKIERVIIRGRVKVADIMHVAQTCPSEKVEAIYLVARMTGLDVAEVERLDLEDYNAIHTEVMAGKSSGVATTS